MSWNYHRRGDVDLLAPSGGGGGDPRLLTPGGLEFNSQTNSSVHGTKTGSGPQSFDLQIDFSLADWNAEGMQTIAMWSRPHLTTFGWRLAYEKSPFFGSIFNFLVRGIGGFVADLVFVFDENDRDVPSAPNERMNIRVQRESPETGIYRLLEYDGSNWNELFEWTGQNDWNMNNTSTHNMMFGYHPLIDTTFDGRIYSVSYGTFDGPSFMETNFEASPWVPYDSNLLRRESDSSHWELFDDAVILEA